MADTPVREVVEAALLAAHRHAGAFEELLPDEALAAADHMDGRALGRLARVPVSVKANIDVRGLVTTGGSPALARASPATDDAPLVAALRAADAVIVGHTAMTELAESAVGRVPGLPNPRNPELVAGGSSTGDAVAVAQGVVRLALATDEGGSARIPAAFCGVVGFRPSHRALCRQGLLPLSPTLDGPALLASDVRTIQLAFATLGNASDHDAGAARLAVPRDHVWDDCHTIVRDAVREAIDRLAGTLHIAEIALPELRDLAALRGSGDFAAAETAAWARSIGLDRDRLGPLARARLERGDALLARDYLHALRERARLAMRLNAQTSGWDALLMPTTPRLPPSFEGLTVEREMELNPHLLRTTRLANLLDRPAISLPTPTHPTAGIMLVGAADSDSRLLGLAAVAERLLYVRRTR